MNETADFVAKKYGISREALDAYVVGSQQRVEAARAAGKFAGGDHARSETIDEGHRQSDRADPASRK